MAIFNIILSFDFGLSLLGCVWLFSSYIISSEKTPGLTIILILGISDLVVAVTTTAGPLFNINNAYFNVLMRCSFHFSAFWAVAMSLMAYRYIRESGFDLHNYLRKSLVIVLSLIGSFAVAVYYWFKQWQLLFINYLASILGVCAVVLTFFFNCKGAAIVKSLGGSKSPLRLYAYVQAITIGLSELLGFSTFFIENNTNFSIIRQHLDTILLVSTGFVNSTIYFIEERKRRRSQKAASAQLDISTLLQNSKL